MRGVSPSCRGNLLSEIAKETKNNWPKMEEYVRTWNDTHDDMVNHYAEKVKFYATKYIDTAAGQKFKDATAAARKSNRKLPGLDAEALRSFDGAEGIPWGHDEVYDIFEILSDVAETVEFDVAVSSPMT
jgi:hypothetical protein